MTEAPIIAKSPLPYQIIIFIIIQIWALMCFEVAQYQMVTLYQSPLSWIVWANLVLTTMLPVLGLCVWKLKDRVQLLNPQWEFKIREVNLREFEEMTKSYNSGYRYLLSTFDYLSLGLLSICYVLVNALPFFLMRTNNLIIGLTPIILALFTMIFGLLFSYFGFKLIPNSATPEFPTHNPRRLRKTISLLAHLPGIFWCGVKLTIGEAGGFYTIRNPIPVARIEGIEGAARIECGIDSSGNLASIVPIFESEDIVPSEQLVEITAPITPTKTSKLVRQMILEYISHSGGEEILADVLEDIDTFLNKHDSIDNTSK
ncbi:MAG: hypothetical protein ACTSU3_01365 [Candidatus Thorarchaeota archaeon]